MALGLAVGALPRTLCRSGLEGAPSMEAARKAMWLVALAYQSELPRVLSILGPHVLDVDLRQMTST